MSKNCGNCGCGSHTAETNCSSKQLSEEEIEKILKDKSKHSRKYTVEYRIKLEKMECTAEELIERIKAYIGLIDQIEFTEEELIISYDDRLITPAEISHLIQ